MTLGNQVHRRLRSRKLHAILLATTFSTGLIAQAEPARDARSVHLSYDVGESSAFYNEVEIIDSQDGSYFMAIGFGGGYFGIQDLVGDEGLVIFSLWDDTEEPNRSNVPESDRAVALSVGTGVAVVPFGNEGVGISARMPFQWDVGSTFRFFITTELAADRTRYTAYFAPPDRDWQLIGVMERPAQGARLAGLYSFVEDFRRDGLDTSIPPEDRSPNQLRSAIFENPWAMATDGTWQAVDTVKFTAWGPHPLDSINAEVVELADGIGFLLATGGDTLQTTELDSQLSSWSVLQAAPEMP